MANSCITEIIERRCPIELAEFHAKRGSQRINKNLKCRFLREQNSPTKENHQRPQRITRIFPECRWEKERKTPRRKPRHHGEDKRQNIPTSFSCKRNYRRFLHA